jgi:DNA polymerase (family 10)
VDNAEIADRLDAFAALLELADANPYTTRAYHRAAEMIRGVAVPVSDLVAAGRVRELRGIGPSIEARLKELVATGRIAELEELERELAPSLIGFGRYLGLSAKRSMEIAKALKVRTAGELRAAAAAGRLRDVPGVGPKTEAQIVVALARAGGRQPQRALLLTAAGDLVSGIADALAGEVAGDVRRWRDACERLAVVSTTSALDRFAALPQIVAVIEQSERRALGVTVEGVPVELIVAEPERFGTEMVRATGSAAYVAALEPLPDGADEESVYAALGIPWCPPELREQPWARRFLARVCLDWGMNHHLDAGALVISELVTNALIHTDSDIDVLLAGDQGRLRIGVRDKDPDPPQGLSASSNSLHGRGLLLVDALSDSSGALPTSDGGKLVWAVLGR